MKPIYPRSLFVVFLLFIFSSVSAQQPVYYDSPQYEYKVAMELFQKEKYGSAQQYFKYVYENTTDKQHDIKSNSYFYMGACAAYLYHNDAIFLLRDFIRNYPVHTLVPDANYLIGKFYFYKKQYKKALEYYEIIDERHIRPEELAEYYFKRGYSYFETKKPEEAKAYLDKARQSGGPYQYRAIYYLAHLAYQEGRYQAALEDFLLLKDHPEYQEIVPLYIAQIYFHQGRYDELIAVAPPLLDKMTGASQDELNRLIALSYYNLGVYDKAATYFMQYIPTSKIAIDRSDNFAIGYTFYQLKEYNKAIQYLSKATGETDAMAQNSFYVIADCYLHTQQLSLASQSFLEASKYDFMPEVQEDALYNYAKLQYATSSSPFNSAIQALENYIATYPNSSRAEEAHSYLSEIYLSTKNYQGAIKALESISSKSPDLLRAYQRCTYFRALELINVGRNKEALKLLDKSLAYPMNKDMRTSALYWKAESEYREGQYKQAYYEFQNYQKAENVKQDENYPVSFYSLGYSALKIGKYGEARRAFTTFLNSKESKNDPKVEADATVRLADCYYMEKDLRSAIQYYEKAERLRQDNADYAVYQQARCYGYLKNDAKKIELLEKLLVYYPRSNYSDDAEFDLATTYHAQNNYRMAITSYKNFIEKYPKSPYIRQAYNKLAQAYLNVQEDDMAITTFKFVFENFPGSQEAKDAMANLEVIYTEQGNTTEFFDYIKNRNMNISETKQDSVTYKAAENKYLRGDCESAIRSFETYIKEFPNGLFIAKAYFYKAECEYGMNSFDAALADYRKIIDNYQTEYNEVALRKSATILFNKKEYEQALTYYQKLSESSSNSNTLMIANAGIMHCTFQLGRYRDALNSARTLLSNYTVDAEMQSEAKIIAGRSAMELKEYNTAKTYLNDLASNNTNDFAAEAAYLGCVIEFEQGNYDECERKITDMLAGNYSSGAEYWFASVFILYGDLYMVKENYFQARHTYQSIIDNYDGEDLKEIARDRIRKLDRLEKIQEEPEPSATPVPETQEEDVDDYIYPEE